MPLALAPLLAIGGKLIERLIPDPEARDKAKLELMRLDEQGELQAMQTSAGIITAEAQGESWIQRTWRPIMMLFFGALVGAYWFGYTPENLSDERVGDLFNLVQIGIGGYIVGRSAEKVTKVWKEK